MSPGSTYKFRVALASSARAELQVLFQKEDIVLPYLVLLSSFLLSDVLPEIFMHDQYSCAGFLQRSEPGCSSLRHRDDRQGQRHSKTWDPWAILVVQHQCRQCLAHPRDEHNLPEAAQEPEPVSGADV